MSLAFAFIHTYLHSKHRQSRDLLPLSKVMLSTAIIGTMTSSDFSHHITSAFPKWVILQLLRPLCYYSKTQVLEMMWDLPSSYKYYISIPLPLRRGRMAPHIQRLSATYSLHQTPIRAQPPHFGANDAAVFASCYGLPTCSPIPGIHTYRFNAEITSNIG